MNIKNILVASILIGLLFFGVCGYMQFANNSIFKQDVTTPIPKTLVPSGPNYNPEPEVAEPAWTFESFYIEEEDTSVFKKQTPEEINACLLAQTVDHICSNSSTTSFELSADFKAQIGVDMENIVFGPEISSMVNNTISHAQSVSITYKEGFIYNIIVTEYNSVNPGKGTFVDIAGKTIEGNVQFFNGSCTISVVVVEERPCSDVAIEPTQELVIVTATPEPATPATVSTQSQSTTISAKEIDSEIVSSTSTSIQVNANEIHVLVFGDGVVDGNTLYGGETRVNIVVLLPKPIQYNFSGLDAGNVAHITYRASEDQVDYLIERYDDEVRQPNKCSNGNACSDVYFLVLGN